MALTRVPGSMIPDGDITAAKLASSLDLSGKTIVLPAANTPAFTKSYTSTNQTITSGGSLTLAHSLGAAPALIQIRLKCLTAEHGYSIGDEVIALAGDANAGRFPSLVPDATNINVRYGSSANAFNIANKTTGASAAITNASWAMIVKAWA